MIKGGGKNSTKEQRKCQFGPRLQNKKKMGKRTETSNSGSGSGLVENKLEFQI